MLPREKSKVLFRMPLIHYIDSVSNPKGSLRRIGINDTGNTLTLSQSNRDTQRALIILKRDPSYNDMEIDRGIDIDRQRQTEVGARARFKRKALLHLLQSYLTSFSLPT